MTNMNKPFKFKQFTVKQDQCAMKIGTDGVLLGAWSTIKKQPFATLDIGAGTGILSLMLAQRCDAEVIDALEIDEMAYEQCVDNFETSPWSDRLFCYHADLAEFTEEIESNALEIPTNFSIIVPEFPVIVPLSSTTAIWRASFSPALSSEY